MDKLIGSFTKQLREAYEIGKKFQPASHQTKNIVISGLGGSGIGGSIVSDLGEEEFKFPVTVIKDYHIPGFVNESTLFIVSSYSGDTEETLSSMEKALERKAHLVCITSGGKVAEKAKSLNLPHIIIPGGMPPRACLAYSFTQLLFVLEGYKALPANYSVKVPGIADTIDSKESSIRELSLKAASFLSKKIPVIYTSFPFNGVAVRFRQQLNENAKMLCWNNIYPEMNHNELVGWADKHPELAVIYLRSEKEFYRTTKRIEISKEIIGKQTSMTELHAEGSSDLEKALYLIHLCDWISYDLSALNGVDPIEIKVINHLKSALSKI